MMGEVIRVSGRAPDVGEFLREAMLSQRFADVALCCPGGQRFLAHRLVLSAVSPYLQEVLLAHSKSTGHCEPITVILAEIEAPELAAILGFVYTGSATVPRPRLEAFLRAAEALHIRLPPVPIVMTRGRKSDDSKEDVKDVKINPKYLQCDQYPSLESWHRGGSSREEPSEKKDNDRVSGPPEISQLPGPLHEQHDFSSKFGPRPQYAAVWQNEHRNVEQEYRSRPNADKNQVRFPNEGLAMMPIDIVDSSARSPVELRPPCVPSASSEDLTKSYHDLCPPRRIAEDFGVPDPLEARLRDYGHRLPTANVPSKIDDVLGGTGRSSIDGSFPENDRIQDRDPVTFAAGNSPHYVSARTRFEKRDYGETIGEDLSCGESCCRWRAPRRQVANRVTASPWRQIVRPHHSPKIRPTVMRCHADETEAERMPVQEASRLPSQPLSSKDHLSPNPMRNDVFYGFEVPTPCELTFCNSVRPLDGPTVQDTRLPDYYKPRISYPTTQPPQAVQPISSELRNTEPYYPASGNSMHTIHSTHTPHTGLTPRSDESPPPTNNVIKHVQANNYLGQIPQTPTKPEISHPVSRLCDTVEDDKKIEVVVSAEVVKPEDIKSDEKIVPGVFVNSDSNNNDAIVGAQGEANQRGARVVGAQEDHRCDQCGKTFVTRASLKVHSRTHSGEKPFRCADCGKQFSQLRNYKYHRSVHEGTREFAATCPECGKYFNDRGYLSSHMKIHRNRKEYGCAECGKSFNQRVAYNMHVRIHTGVKPHQCEQCGKAFSRKMLLKQHLRTHSGERPYQCQVCQKAFADRSNMTLHTRLHSGLKPYQCTLCSKAFTKKHHLKTHLNYHTGTKPYSCSNCGLRFSQSSNMRTHFKKCTVNNPGGLKSATDGGNVNVSANSKDGMGVQTMARGSAETLTPPNSDQESSILTPISKNPPVEGSVT